MPTTTTTDPMTARIIYARLKPSRSLPALPALPGLLSKTLVDRLDEHGRRPGRIGSETTVPIFARLGRLDLRQRHPLLDHVLDTIANDGAHVAVVRQVRQVSDPSVSADELRAASCPDFGHRHVDYAVERVQDALNAAALLDVDRRIGGHSENVAGGNDVGVSKVHEAVAVGRGGWSVKQYDPFTVEEVTQLHL